MIIPDERLREVERDGYAVVRDFIPREEAVAALGASYRVYKPPFDAWIAAGRKNPIANPRGHFPWDHAMLNRLCTHPDLIDASERMIGTRRLLLTEAILYVKYQGGDEPVAFHQDYGNNTFGPEVKDPRLMLRNPAFVVYLTDVGPDDAPIRMVAHGRPEAEAVPILGAAGTLIIYTTFTVHSASHFGPTGRERAALWIMMSDASQLWDLPRAYTYKYGVDFVAMRRFVREASPRQLELLGFPPAGSPFWSEEVIAGMAERYPGFPGELYRPSAARMGASG
jgi:hypothetical protein